jgi:hypothetical protein
VCFEVRSSDAEVMEAARGVFSRWPADDRATLKGQWEIHRVTDGFAVDPEPVPPPGTTVPEIRTAGQAVTVVEYSAMWQIVEQCTDLLCFHSALLSKNGKGVAIVGPSEAGKSTLSTGLWQNAWTFLCDDMTMVRGVKAVPGPRRVSLREGSRSLVGDELWKAVESAEGYQKTLVGCLFHPPSVADTEREVDLSAIIFLKRSGARADVTGPTQLVPAEAALALLPYTNLVRALSFPEALAPIATLMSSVPAYDLPRAPLAEMIDAVERLAGVSPDRISPKSPSRPSREFAAPGLR